MKSGRKIYRDLVAGKRNMRQLKRGELRSVMMHLMRLDPANVSDRSDEFLAMAVAEVAMRFIKGKRQARKIL